MANVLSSIQALISSCDNKLQELDTQKDVILNLQSLQEAERAWARHARLLSHVLALTTSCTPPRRRGHKARIRMPKSITLG